MNRDFESAEWARSHHQLGDALARIIEKAGHGFERLSAIQYHAPWKRGTR